MIFQILSLTPIIVKTNWLKSQQKANVDLHQLCITNTSLISGGKGKRKYLRNKN